MRTRFLLVAVALTALMPAVVLADPELFVTFEGVNASGNNVFKAAVAPDPAFFHDTTSGFGGSMAVELAFAVSGSTIASIDINEVNWDFANPGNNPFTDTMTNGTWISPENDNAFTSYGSPVFLSGDPMELFTMETLGSALTTVDYGVAASGDEVKGATIAQRGENFSTGGLTLLDLMALSSGSSGAGGGSGGVDTKFFSGYTGSVSSVPEPASVLLAAVAMLAGVFGGYRRCR